MHRQFIFVVFLLIFSAGSNGQTADHSAPVKWEPYSDEKINFSVALPKLPTRLAFEDRCHKIETITYLAYAEEVVYEMEVRSPIAKKSPGWCTAKGDFDAKAAFEELVKRRNLAVQTSEKGFELASYVEEELTRWVLLDARGNRIFRLTTRARPDTKVDEKRYVQSVSATARPGSVPIGDGAPQILGDRTIPDPIVAKSTQDATTGTEYPLQILRIPRATYTETARRKDTKGSVILNVTFLGNGAIGAIEVMKELENGLTEEAIKAARQIVFLPKKVNGITVPVTVRREYTFSIY